MFGFLKRKNSTPETTANDEVMPVHFKSGDAALEMACKYMDCALAEGTTLPALVLDAHKLFGTEASVKVQVNGIQLAMLRVASSDGGFLVAASTVGAIGPRLEPGQLVAWQAMSYAPELAKAGAADERFAWVGLIVGTLKSEFVNGSWVGNGQFLPEPLPQEASRNRAPHL